MSEQSHQEPFEGDNGLLFDPDDEFEPEDSRFYKPSTMDQES